MRSSVSVILSSPPPDTTMSYPDYSTHPNHHSAILVLVKQVGCQLKSSWFQKVFERISRVTHLQVSDSSGQPRPVLVNYRKDYPVENNDWGDFQAHRRVLGLITVGHVCNQSDLNEVCKQHESLKVKYSSTAYDSRCVILGVNPDGSVHHSDSSRGSSPDLNGVSPESSPALAADRDSGVYENSHDSSSSTTTSRPSHNNGTSPPSSKNQISSSKLPPSSSSKVVQSAGSDSGSECTSEICTEEADSPRSLSATESSCLQPPLCFKTRALFFPTVDHTSGIETQVQEFVSSLFWVLEYKRMDKSQEKNSSVPSNDKPLLLCAPFERKDMIGLDMDSRTNKKKCFGRLKKNLADLSLQTGLANEALAQYTQAIDILKGCNDWLWLAACYEGLCSTSVMLLYPRLSLNNALQRHPSLGPGGATAPQSPTNNKTNSLPTGLEPSAAKQQTPKHCLSPEDVVEKYKEAIVHYSKYRNAGVIETEASIKAVHVLIEQKKYLLAAEFLSNVVFINLQLSDEEKIIRFNALSELYNQIGFHRKASFFRRVAAMRCVAPQNQEPDWNHCYKLLLLTLDGYRLSLDLANFVQDGRPGWPALQVQILQELVGTSRRMGENSLCTRHQAFLLSAMLPHFPPADLTDTYKMLEVVSLKSPSGPQPLTVQGTATIVPPVNFINIPFCKQVKVVAPSKEKQVEHRNQEPVDDLGPFIFSPFQSMVVAKAIGAVDCEWVEGDVCEVKIAFVNPMPFQIKFNSMILLTEGIEFEPWTSTVILEADLEAQWVSLRGRPQEAGELRIIGYSSNLLGVSSCCRFKSMAHLKVPFYSLNVVPALPCVQIFCDSSSSGTGLVSEGGLEESSKVCLTMDAGETRECSIALHNASSQRVDGVEVALVESTPGVFEYSLDNLRAQLPILPGGRASLTLYVYAASDFLVTPEEDESLLTSSEPSSLVSTQGGNLSSLPSSRHSGRTNKARRAQSSASSRSGNSLKSSSFMSSTNAPNTTHNLTPKTLEGTIRLSYSGGKGMETHYWRVAEVRVTIEVTPSLLVTRWDALPAERPNQCYVVLDVLNSSLHEMDLQYTLNKHLLIQAQESCRVPIPVDRCPISKLNAKPDEDEAPDPGEVLGDHLGSLVELRWTLGTSETPGRASLRSLTFPLHTHHLITMAPIHWDVKLNNEIVNGGTENCGLTGQIQHLTVGVSNASGGVLPPLKVALSAYQDHQNGTLNDRLETKMAATGATKYLIPNLSMEESHSHTCGLVFFTAGVFKIELSCEPTSYENSSHPWKLAPPIEITLVDP